jgi:hypothetical protein
MWQKRTVFLSVIVTLMVLGTSCVSQDKSSDGGRVTSSKEADFETKDINENNTTTIPEEGLASDNTGYTLGSIEMEKGEGYDVFVYIDAYVPEDNALFFNVVEWVDTPERAAELGIDYEHDMPGGFYIYDEVNVSESLPLEEDYCYNMLNETTPMTVEHQVLYSFIDYMHEEGFSYPFKIRILNEKITQVEQVYMP